MTIPPDPALPIPSEMDLLLRCVEWLAMDWELDRLSRRWAELETKLAREHGWLQLSQEARRTLPEATPLFQVEAEIEALSHKGELALAAIVAGKARSIGEIAGKLAVAARLLRQEETPANRLVVDVVRALSVCCAISLDHRKASNASG